MRAYACGASALSHYRCGFATTSEDAVDEVLVLDDALSAQRDLELLGIYQLGMEEATEEDPLCLMVGSQARRSGAASIRTRVWSTPLPPGSFHVISNRLYVSSPELLFLEMAPKLTLPELIALGMELCGSYRRNAVVGTDDAGNTLYKTAYEVPALTTPEKMGRYLESVPGVRGSKAARVALKYVLPDSASPMETIVYLLICLQRRYGGYGMPRPQLNSEIVFSKRGQTHTVRKSASPDLYWEQARFDLEYVSDEFHTTENRAQDSMRRKALERMKVEVVDLTYEEVCDEWLFHAVVQRLARRLGKQIRPDSERGFANKRSFLRNALLYGIGADGSRV